LPGS
jgi:hypothetical protein